MLRDRLLTAAIVLPVLFFLICCAPAWAFAGGVFALTCIGLYEFFLLSRKLSVLPVAVGVGWGGCVAGAMLVWPPLAVSAVLIGGFFIVFCLALQEAEPDRGLLSVSVTLLGVVYIGFLLPHLAWVRYSVDGAAWVFFILLVAMMGDSGGYAVGRLWGRHQLIVHISPGKTVEGSGGAIVGNLVAAGIGWLWLFPDRTVLELAVLAIVLGLLAQIGDLCESALKRACGVKDSGQIFPGHGGVLDRADSLLFPAAFIYYYVTLWK